MIIKGITTETQRQFFTRFFLCLCGVSVFLWCGCSSLSRHQKYPVPPGLQTKPVELKQPNTTLRVGEKLTYTVRWLAVPVGTITIWVKEKTFWQGRESYHLVADGQANKFLSTFYKVTDHYESYWDVEGRFSRRFEKKVQQRKYHANEVMSYDSDQKKAIYYAVEKNETKHYTIPGPVQDPLSAVYYFRTSIDPPDQKTQFLFNADEKNWEVQVQHLEQGILEVRNLGVFEAFLVEPTAKRIDSSDSKEKKEKPSKVRVWIWFSADERRLPLLIRISAALVGEVSVQLEAIE